MSNTSFPSKQLLNTFAIICFLMFVGRAYQHIFWDAPYRTLLWEEGWLENIVNWFGVDWQDYVTSPKADQTIQFAIRISGVIYLLCAIACLLILQNPATKLKNTLYVGISLLAFLFLLQTKEKFFHVGQFFEHTAQIISPILLLLISKQKITRPQFHTALKVAIALTFCCHGLYAIGYYPRPGIFVDMTINILGCSETFAHQFLFIAGVLDFVIVLLLFFPKTQKFAIYYTLIWGLLTALARTVAFFDLDFPFQTLHQNSYQTLVRIPHMGLSLLLGLSLGYLQQKFRFKATHFSLKKAS